MPEFAFIQALSAFLAGPAGLTPAPVQVGGALPSASDQAPDPMRVPIPMTCTSASASAACAVVIPRVSCRKSTVNPTRHIWGQSRSAAEPDRIHRRRSRKGPSA